MSEVVRKSPVGEDWSWLINSSILNLSGMSKDFIETSPVCPGVWLEIIMHYSH